MATEHECLRRATGEADMSFLHDKGRGMPKRKGCSRCGSPLITYVGRYVVYRHRGDGRYGEADTVATFATARPAERLNDELNGRPYPSDAPRGYVVHFDIDWKATEAYRTERGIWPFK